MPSAPPSLTEVRRALVNELCGLFLSTRRDPRLFAAEVVRGFTAVEVLTLYRAVRRGRGLRALHRTLDRHARQPASRIARDPRFKRAPVFKLGGNP